ncbi:MAG TPA: dihydrolipoyl dehydrogenase [Magnetospirillaceae bacterium]|jgi:dihydrolipoamide dehydrogenase
MADTDFDVVVIGGGPGGYVAAIRAAQLGQRTAVVEKGTTLGGTCVNVGCIPSKALLQSSHLYDEAKNHLGPHGIKIGKVELDLGEMQSRKVKVVKANTDGLDFLMKKNKITRLLGAGKITAPGKVEISGKDAKSITTKTIIIATGSDSTPLPGVTIDEKQIVTSTGALDLPAVPKHLVVIGAGVIGLELGSVWRRLGAEVTVIEFLDRALPQHDGEISKQAQRILEKQGMKFMLGTKVTAAKPGKDVALTVEPAKGGAAQEIKADVVLVAIGRRPYTEGLGLKEVGVELDKRGFVVVDKHFQTKIPGIYAIGDVIGGLMLAHKAEDEGYAAAELIAGQAGHVNYDAIPGVVYTWPEVANLGKTEEQLKAEGVAYKVGKFPFTANGRARANGDTEGFVKILADAKTDRVIGCHIIGPQAGDLLAEVVIGVEFATAAEDIARSCHAHPSLSEAVKEAALGVAGLSIHI